LIQTPRCQLSISSRSAASGSVSRVSVCILPFLADEDRVHRSPHVVSAGVRHVKTNGKGYFLDMTIPHLYEGDL